MAFLTHNDLQVTEREITLPGWPAALNGLRVAQISDLHFYEYSSPAYYDSAFRVLDDLTPDLLLLTGDIVHWGTAYLPMAAEFLSRTRAKYGKIAILGNHDFAVNGTDRTSVQAPFFDTLNACGFTTLKNEHARLTIHGVPLYVAGLHDLWYGRPDIEQALAGIPEEAALVMLSHNPLMFDPVACHFSDRVHLVLSGHTHAGHVYIPFLKPVYEKIFRMKYRYGLFHKEDCTLHVTSGIGSAAFYCKRFGFGFPRFRWNTRPEIALLRLQGYNGG